MEPIIIREMECSALGKYIPAVCLAFALASGCAARTGPTPRTVPGSPPEPTEVSAAAAGVMSGETIILTALDLRGTPYRNGGETPDGFDCSGFTRYVFSQHGIELPRRVSDQYAFGTPIARDALAPGDLVFFTTVATGASHVGVSTGDGRFVHAPSSRGRVRVEALSSPYWTTRYFGARRVLLD